MYPSLLELQHSLDSCLFAGGITCDSMRFHPDMELIPQAQVLQYIRDRSDPLKIELDPEWTQKAPAKEIMCEARGDAATELQDEQRTTNKIRQALSVHLRHLMRFLEMK
ncbi:hypothetical protein PRIPAC_76217 [Pristionchus pacificus]|uniref:Uncharacterized protein n=1 Tax=Pristionchus pacificus TaxID=54126 RepID=A0A2A6C145_PRIPA|nr:hypothetical protein PRIPAC_76217 [Pristionchus pacificus]|eukprot:PDM71836.1 hypothetical protein PRIPAC_38243 [Pristionchus pacificus]